MSADPTAFFALERHDPATPCRAPWRPLSEMAAPSPAWADRIAVTSAALAAAAGVPVVEPRVAASVVQLGMCARVVAPALAAAADGRVVDTGLDALRWQPVLGGPFPLSAPVGDEATADVVTALSERLLPTLAAFVAAARAYSVSPLVAWGNVASALQSAAGLLSADRRTDADLIATIVAELFARPPLAGTGDRDASGRFRRRSCCLIYRAAPGPAASVCGDCVLDPVITTRHRRASRR